MDCLLLGICRCGVTCLPAVVVLSACAPRDAHPAPVASSSALETPVSDPSSAQEPELPCPYDVTQLPVEDARHHSVKRLERMQAGANRLLGASIEEAEAACEKLNPAEREACISEQLEEKQRQALQRAGESFEVMDSFFEQIEACDALKDAVAAKECHDAIERKAAIYVEQMQSEQRRQRDARLTREWLRLRNDEGCSDPPQQRCGMCATLAALTAANAEPPSKPGRFVGPGVVRSLQGHRTLELVFVQIQARDASEELCASFVTPENESEAEAIRSALRALLAGELPRDNAAYAFAQGHPFEAEDCFALERLDTGQLEARSGDWLLASSGGRMGFRARFWGEQRGLLLADLKSPE